MTERYLQFTRGRNRYLQTMLSLHCIFLAGSNKSSRLCFIFPPVTSLKVADPFSFVFGRRDEGNNQDAHVI